MINQQDKYKLFAVFAVFLQKLCKITVGERWIGRDSHEGCQVRAWHKVDGDGFVGNVL